LEKHIANLKILAEARNYLIDKRQINADTIDKYKVGATMLRSKGKNAKGIEEFVEHICISFPWIDSDGNVIRLKVRSIKDKTLQRLDPTGIF